MAHEDSQNQMPQEGTWICLVEVSDEPRRWTIHLNGQHKKTKGLGWVDTARLLATPLYSEIELVNKSLMLVPPDLVDLTRSMKRRAQIITLKDAMTICGRCAIGPGRVVVEAGAGSGGFTMVAGWLVGPSGRIISYELRPEFAETVRENMERGAMLDRWTLHEDDVTQGIQERNVDAVVLDFAKPWLAIPAATEALRPGGRLATYSPNSSQVEQTRAALDQGPFSEVSTLEVLEREIVVAEKGGIRPATKMLGHTGYLTFARKLGSR